MNALLKVLAHKLFALTVLVGVGLWLLVIPAFIGQLGANPLEKLLQVSGEIAIWTFGAVLALSPLRALLPNSRVVTALNRHRRAIGVTACIYALLHFSSHVLYEGGWNGLVRSLSKPFIWFGAAGLTILVILAMTSNQWSVRLLGGKNWKLLHRLAYVAAGLLIYHQAIAGKGHWATARWLLLPFAALQLARLAKRYRGENAKTFPAASHRMRCSRSRSRAQCVQNKRTFVERSSATASASRR
ncbi:MAG: methionine sulfoxide reductase heme-binding subunit [Verrucomicrobiota bacterium]|jgi:sulfoxide reductase heme-binding subunit YedZ